MSPLEVTKCFPDDGKEKESTHMRCEFATAITSSCSRGIIELERHKERIQAILVKLEEMINEQS